MKSSTEIIAERVRIQTMRRNFERDYRWRRNYFYYVKALDWVLERSEFTTNSEESK